MMRFKKKALERQEEVSIEDGDEIYLLVQANDQTASSITASFHIVAKERTPTKPLLIEKEAKKKRREASPSPEPFDWFAQQSASLDRLEFAESTQEIKEYFLSDAERQESAAAAAVKQDDEIEIDLNDSQGPVAPVPKKKTKLVQRSEDVTEEPSQQPPVRIVKSKNASSTDCHSQFAWNTLKVLMLGFSDINDQENSESTREDAKVGGLVSTTLKDLGASVSISQYSLFQDDLKYIQVVCVHDQAFHIREYNRHFAFLRLNPHVEFVSPSFLLDCCKNKTFIAPSLDASVPQRLLASDVFYILFDESGLELLPSIQKLLDSDHDKASHFKLKMLCKPSQVDRLSSKSSFSLSPVLLHF